MSTARVKKLSASLEDYLEAIWNLADEANGARSKDIAKALGVARSSVTGAVRLLRDKGLANYEPYGRITLTPQGRMAAEDVVRRHEVLKSFFADVLGVKADVAQHAACRAEHSFGPEIIGRLVSFVDYVADSCRRGRDVVDEFQRFRRRRSAKPKGKAS